MELPINRQLSEEEEQTLKESLKRCPAGTFEAVKAFRENGELERIPEIVEGIAERFLEPEIRPLLKKGDNTRLSFLLDRTIGKVKDVSEVTHKSSHRSILDQILGKGKDEDE